MRVHPKLKVALVASPVLVMFIVGLTVKLPITDSQGRILGILLLLGALTFSIQAHRITKFVVEKYGPEHEVNPVARESFAKGIAAQDHLVVWIAIIGLVSFDYFYFRGMWFPLTAGAFGTMFLDWLNDYLVLRQINSGDFA